SRKRSLPTSTSSPAKTSPSSSANTPANTNGASPKPPPGPAERERFSSPDSPTSGWQPIRPDYLLVSPSNASLRRAASSRLIRTTLPWRASGGKETSSSTFQFKRSGEEERPKRLLMQ